MRTCSHVHLQIPKTYTHYAATALFFFFGIKSIYDAFFRAHEVSEVQGVLSECLPCRP
jgi:putative Mn2+ efflux pump MntP